MPGELASTWTAMAGRMKTLAPKLVTRGPYRSRNQPQAIAPKAIQIWVIEPHKATHFELWVVKEEVKRDKDQLDMERK
jgi:hypothetical protein